MKHLFSAKAHAEALDLSSYVITHARKAGKLVGDPIPRYSTAEQVAAWFTRNPWFVAFDWQGDRWKKKFGPNPRKTLFGKSDAPSMTSAPQTASPNAQVFQVEQVG